MKIWKFLAITLVVAFGFGSCNPEDNHDHNSDLAGTWTCLTTDFAEAMVINEDGSVVSTILIDGNYIENMEGNIVVENDIVTLSFEDGTKVEGHFDIIPGMAFSGLLTGVRIPQRLACLWVRVPSAVDFLLASLYNHGFHFFSVCI